MKLLHSICFAVTIVAIGSSHGNAAKLYNKEAVIPPQCYTQTEGKYNPCYICHQSYPKGSHRNQLNDGVLQGNYGFSDLGLTNHWRNLFPVTAPAPLTQAEFTDAQLDSYVASDNYQTLYARSQSGINQASYSEKDDGYLPDLANLGNPSKAFDDQGFALDGSGWVAFNYKPLPSTFWPTNGSFDDVMIRLPNTFRESAEGVYSKTIYLLNLSLVEIAVKRLASISIPVTDEKQLGIDLDGDGRLTQTKKMHKRDYYLGGASNIKLLPEQFPVGTAFLHSLRYLQVNKDKSLAAAPRMKELRYMKKYKYLNDKALAFSYNQEQREKELGMLPVYAWAKPIGKAGINNKIGWTVKGWIEDEKGQLRRQSYEENLACMGCHTSVGATIDSTFSFARKVTGSKGWRYIDLKGMKDVPSYGESKGEILTYLKRVGGGDEFRQNDEMLKRWFVGGNVKTKAITDTDVFTLITPSPERAYKLNRAYLALVKAQAFIYGRDLAIGNKRNVYQQVDLQTAPLLPPNKQFTYDMRLLWPEE